MKKAPTAEYSNYGNRQTGSEADEESESDSAEEEEMELHFQLELVELFENDTT